MSTRGVYGLFKNGMDKVLYNHFDSYPTVLGNNILDFIVNNDNDRLNEIFDTIRVVRNNDIPTKEDVNKVVDLLTMEKLEKELIGKVVFTKDDGRIEGYNKEIENENDIIEFLKENYYNLLSLVPTEDFFENGLGIFEDYTSFIGDSLFCEYAYIMNLDTNSLEFYIGGNKKPTGNRFSKYTKNNENSYVECRLMLSIPFDVIRDNKVAILDIMEFLDKKFEE